MEYTPLRPQFPFDTTGMKYMAKSDMLRMQRQWETFERIENYNDVIYQRFMTGDRSQTYYQFRSREELSDYRAGQQLHMLAYPDLACTAFEPISDQPMPDVPVIAQPPNYNTSIPRNVIVSTSMTASEATKMQADMAVYVHVSTYNAEHKYKYNFVSDEEKMAYHAAERRVRMSAT